MVLAAVDGASALQVAQAHPGPIHLLLTDVIMPGMNGHELAQKLLALRPTAKVIYMSGYTENAVAITACWTRASPCSKSPSRCPRSKKKCGQYWTPQRSPRRSQCPVVQYRRLRLRDLRETLTFRAQRFNLHLPLRYRPVGEQSWRKGTTENISRSGMLFHAEEDLQPNMQLEINLVLPVEIAGLAATEVVCRGEVVRTVETPGSKVMPALAAKILQYHFQHGSRVSQA